MGATLRNNFVNQKNCTFEIAMISSMPGGGVSKISPAARPAAQVAMCVDYY